MSLPLYRINDQVIFENPIGEAFSVGMIQGIQQAGETWRYSVDYTIITNNSSSKQKAFLMEEFIRGVLFESIDKMECNERTTAEEAISLDF